MIHDGVLLAHFSKNLRGRRWKLMHDLHRSLPVKRMWLSKDISHSFYTEETKRYWNNLLGAKEVLARAEGSLREALQRVDYKQVEKLRDCMEMRAWDQEELERATMDVNAELRSAATQESFT